MSLVTVRRGSILTTSVDNADNRILPDFEFTVTVSEIDDGFHFNAI